MDLYTLTNQEVLERIARHCPASLSAYLQCINRADEEGVVFFDKNMVDIDMSEDWRAFRNNIKKLSRENLLEWQPFNNGIAVTLVDQHAND